MRQSSDTITCGVIRLALFGIANPMRRVRKGRSLRSGSPDSALLFANLYEGFGLPVIEAMACGAPVITSKVSSLPEVAGEAAMLVCPDSIEQIAAALQRVLCEFGLSANLTSRGIGNVRRYSWK